LYIIAQFFLAVFWQIFQLTFQVNQ